MQACEVLRELTALVSANTLPDVPVPACLNHCINQEAFACKICGETFENIHTYVTHGRGHRGSSSLCAFCGKVWPSYSALSLHQLVWERGGTCGCGRPKGPHHICPGSLHEAGLLLGGGAAAGGGRSAAGGGGGGPGGPLVACPLECGLDPVALPFLRSHLVAFHGCELDAIKVTEGKDGKSREVSATLTEEAATCPRCHTRISKEKVGLNPHLAFHCLARSRAVQQRIASLQHLATTAGEEPLMLLTQEIQGLLLHLTGLLNGSGYAERYAEEARLADRKYNKLPPGFSADILSWVPRGYTLQVLELEGANFPVIFDVWSQVVERCAGPPEDIRDLLHKLEDNLLKNLTSGLVPRWGNLNFDPAMLDPPDQDVLADLERQLGWVK